MEGEGASPRPRLGDLLLRSGAIDEGQLERALAAQDERGRPLGMTLVHLGALDEETLIRALSAQLSLPIVHLRGKRVSQEVLDLVPLDLAEKHRCLPLLLKDSDGERVLYLAMEDPANEDALEDVRRESRREVRAVLVAPTELDEALHRFYHWASFASAGAPSQADGLDDVEPIEGDGDLLLLEEPVTPAAATDPLSAPPSHEADSGSLPPEVILRALTQLLVEKGILSREELVERLRKVRTETDA